ncbi:MAG: hypothetical protein ACLP5V_05410 [Candidatus Bathyarchaeia archaeon]
MPKPTEKEMETLERGLPFEDYAKDEKRLRHQIERLEGVRRKGESHRTDNGVRYGHRNRKGAMIVLNSCIDFSVIQALESDTLELHDFYFAGND